MVFLGRAPGRLNSGHVVIGLLKGIAIFYGQMIRSSAARILPLGRLKITVEFRATIAVSIHFTDIIIY